MELKKCKFCGKDVQNLPSHIVRIHPAVYEALDEMTLDNTGQGAIVAPVSPNLPAPNPRIGGISALIQEKLDIMLNIKIIEMLSKSPETSIRDIATALNPPQSTPLDELKKYHDLVYGEETKLPYIETGNEWVNVAQQAIPIVKDMLDQRKQVKQKMEGENDVREGNADTPRLLKPIQFEIAGSSTKSGSNSQESGIISNPK